MAQDGVPLGLNSPQGVYSDGTRLYAVDNQNARVLIWNTIPTTNEAAANVVVGQPNLNQNVWNYGGSTSAQDLIGPTYVYTDGTRLYVADSGNNRILILELDPDGKFRRSERGLGQPDMTSSGNATDAQSLFGPISVFSDGTKVYVGDSGNNRIIIWNSIPTANGTAANMVLGQPNMTSGGANNGGLGANSLHNPYSVYGDGTKLYVADYSNNRALIWNTIPTANQASANVVLGQPNMTSSVSNQGGLGAQSLSQPASVYSDGTKLYVADNSNNRSLIWNAIPTANQTLANVALGQPNMTSNNSGTSAQGLSAPWAVTANGTTLVVSDANNNRVLVWDTIPTISQAAANVVLGQADMTSGACSGCAPTAGILYTVEGTFSDGTRLYVADNYNNRVLIWNAMPTTDGAAANVVVGQADMTSGAVNAGGLSAQSLKFPTNIFSDGTRLYVADEDNHRVLIWNAIPTANHAAANVVLGQLNMTLGVQDYGGVTAQSMSYPNSPIAMGLGFMSPTVGITASRFGI